VNHAARGSAINKAVNRISRTRRWQSTVSLRLPPGHWKVNLRTRWRAGAPPAL